MEKKLGANKNDDRVIFGLFGAGGFAREVMPIVDRSSLSDIDPNDIYFVETNPEFNIINGYNVISEEQFFGIECKEKLFNIAIGDSALREKIANNCILNGAKPIHLHSKNCIIDDHNEIGDGSILCHNTIVTSNAKIGKFFHANIFSYVAHDCVIGDFVTFAPSVHCNGNVHIHDHAYIGTNVVIKQGSPSKPLIIGEGAIIGMGAVVTKDVPPHTTVVGNPAKPFVKN
ncbi:acetyltransferase [Brevundimonas sp.]|uniref:acetyltransferase n=1 Tax=Brevundimonas sp. TaxID=1871086 RepID=UPI00289CF947|nr:acetyltransferase [Brevundimonas sp.]